MESWNVITVGIALVIVAAVLASAAFTNNAIASISGAPTSGNSPTFVSGVQDIRVRMSGLNYILDPATVQPGRVRMTFDMNTVTGCMRSVVIPSFGVRELLTTSDNVIEFTADKEGTFSITCGMGMGRGSFQVDDGSGAPIPAAQPVAAVATQGGSCGASGGGCGCGSR